MAKAYRHLKFISILLCILIVFGLVNIKRIGRVVFPMKYQKQIYTYSNTYKVDPLLIASIIRAESSFLLRAKSHKGAIGLMQIMPKTGRWAAKEIGIKNYSDEKLYDEDINIIIGCWFVNKLSVEFDGNMDLVLAAYNAGSGNVNKWINDGKISIDNIENIPFVETKNYVKRISIYLKIYKFLYN
ncbi:lytic transglycosylase domain-containing protein [Abyssisolibacter fermentans]|uniref:lytic transglycosylase domain-containing protein n=1 Tax=Abyssisolibacter fermentans TaxID=1766203 RepID=UPI0009EB6A76|nr:lytic transglycosylase domain-containing protein [Abyssisolibacter fermentans]